MGWFSSSNQCECPDEYGRSCLERQSGAYFKSTCLTCWHNNLRKHRAELAREAVIAEIEERVIERLKKKRRKLK